MPPIVIKETKYKFQFLGSSYGGKLFCPHLLSKRPFVISGGMGEDISFDIELANCFNAEIAMIDPTEKAIHHFEQVKSRIGLRNETQYNSSGRQNPESYDLEFIFANQLTHYEFALYGEDNVEIPLYPPIEKEHSSFSSQNLQKSKELPIMAPTIQISSILEFHQKKNIDILKLDIEGAEYEVLKSCFASGIYPLQILVEIDEMYYPGIRNYRRALKTKNILLKNGYVFVGRGQDFDYCLIHKSFLD